MTDVVTESVSRDYGNGEGLKVTNLHIRSGEFLVILGPSGSGKSTLLRLISGFERPDTGRIMIGGVDTTHVPPERRPTAMVFQSPALWPHMSVYDNIAFGLKVRRLPRAQVKRKVTQVLRLVELEHLEGRRPSQLSGGQRQRVALARAIALEPEVLLLDEPLSALDARLRDTLRAELRALQERLGVTSVYVTHDQEDALVLADRVAVVNQGRILQLGTPEEIYERPADAFVARFCGDSVLIPARVNHALPDGRLECLLLGNLALTVAGGDPHADYLTVRPQALALTDTPTCCSLPARVRTRRYAGGEYALELELAIGLDFTLTTRDDGLQPGTQCHVHLPPDRMWAVKDTATTMGPTSAPQTDEPTPASVRPAQTEFDGTRRTENHGNKQMETT